MIKFSNKNEQRCSERISINRKVNLDIQAETYPVKMVDISHCGIGIVSPKVLQDNTLLEIEFDLPGYEQNSNIKTQAQVIHSTPINHNYLIGLAFINLNLHSQLVIKEFSNFHNRFNA
ncbi:PilZ domain-containing protein [Thiomicrorhabdus sp. Milos-T2]|uniref:PilZ domain-containing protein n=1 Tax=Thiomicrorhabdus sp. Milos-T2 TaxID=90814 RepID=UPI00049463CD|nr:PilZ domain-containing protein [Thiomicrorhabdus sp. Milos-T2]